MVTLRPEYIDFAERVELDGRGEFKDFVRPSVKTILDSVRQDGDYLHPAWAILIQNGGDWVPKDR
ncbi:MAG: hypothetical protein R3C03_02685 [Pirellulaceae bacterium]